ncbi:hypothetical protein YC2023_059125 [Brassica napus]
MIKASSSYSHGTSECGDDEALESLQDRVSFLKQYHVDVILFILLSDIISMTGDIHEEAESYNRLLDKVVVTMEEDSRVCTGN